MQQNLPLISIQDFTHLSGAERHCDAVSEPDSWFMSLWRRKIKESNGSSVDVWGCGEMCSFQKKKKIWKKSRPELWHKSLITCKACSPSKLSKAAQRWKVFTDSVGVEMNYVWMSLFFFFFCKSKLDNGKKARISSLENKHEIKRVLFHKQCWKGMKFSFELMQVRLAQCFI